MKFITTRELKTQASRVERDLKEEKDLVLTKNGKPFALMCTVGEKDLDAMLREVKIARGRLAMRRMQAEADEKGLDRMELDKINALIKKVRRGRGRNKKAA